MALFCRCQKRSDYENSKILIIIFLLAIVSCSFAQTGELDSLRYALDTTDDVSARAKLLYSIGASYNYQDIDSSTHYMRQVITATPDERLKTDALQWLSALFKYSRPDSAFYYGNLGLKLAREYGFDDIQPAIFINFAMTEHAIGNAAQAVQFALEAVKLAEETDNLFNQAYATSVLGMALITIGSYEKAISSERQILKYWNSAGLSFHAGVSLGKIALSHAHLNQKDSAIFYIQQALDILPKQSNPHYFSSDIFGNTYFQIGDMENALNFFRTSIKSPELYLAFNGTLAIAEIYQSQNELDSALFYGKRALEIAKHSGFYSSIIRANSFLSHMYTLVDSEIGIKYAHDALLYRDSLTAVERGMNIADFLDEDTQQRQREIEEAKKDFQSRLRTNAFLGISFTLLLIATLLYRNNRQKQRSKRKIEIAYERLKATQAQLIQSEKMASLGELTTGIAHEIQNPLNFVNNFSEVSSELIDEAKMELEKGDVSEAKSLLTELIQNLEKINHHGQRASSIVKGMLDHSRTSVGEKILTDLNNLCDEYLRLAYHGMRAKDKSFNVEIKADLDPGLPGINVVPQDIGRVLINLINNGFYSVHEKAKGESNGYKPLVIVSTTKVGDKIEIKVTDNGRGIPEDIKNKIFQPFFTTKAPGSGTGLGLSLSYDIV